MSLTDEVREYVDGQLGRLEEFVNEEFERLHARISEVAETTAQPVSTVGSLPDPGDGGPPLDPALLEEMAAKDALSRANNEPTPAVEPVETEPVEEPVVTSLGAGSAYTNNPPTGTTSSSGFSAEGTVTTPGYPEPTT